MRTGSEILETLDILKSLALLDPFTKSIEVKFYMKSNITLQEKQSCMKKELKYALMSCSTRKESIMHNSD